ncbi:MAG: cytochrome C556 [Rhodospirillaceae bacterium]|nr:cytochrome C556 [Rhodospirillaceae bacterium]|tara:strand:- start:533 stop:1027 length:495 start_codon:yes stop_codon:yes gene_type:complete
MSNQNWENHMFTVRKLKRAGLVTGAALALAVTFTLFNSNEVCADNHADRNTDMKSLGRAMRALGAAVAAGNTADAEAAAKKISAIASEVPELFNGGKPGKSRAKPEIWTNFADFTAKANAMKAKADGVAADAAAGKLSSDPKAVVGKIGATCGACHKVYRGPKV